MRQEGAKVIWLLGYLTLSLLATVTFLCAVRINKGKEDDLQTRTRSPGDGGTPVAMGVDQLQTSGTIPTTNRETLPGVVVATGGRPPADETGT